jgi:hypothetical protein
MWTLTNVMGMAIKLITGIVNILNETSRLFFFSMEYLSNDLCNIKYFHV